MNRRSFLRTGAAASPGTLFALSQAAATPCPPPEPDSITASAGTEYFFIGNGRMTAAIQSVTSKDNGTHAGMVLFSPQHFTRKAASFLYHPAFALRRSVVHVLAGGKTYTPEPGQSSIAWEYPDGIPTIRIEWKAAECAITERLFCAAEEAAIIRQIMVRNAGAEPAQPVIISPLQPNTALFDEYSVEAGGSSLVTAGYQRLELFAAAPVEPNDRERRIPVGPLRPGEEAQITLVLTLDQPRSEFERKPMARLRAETAAYWVRTHSIQTGHAGLDHFYRVSQSGIRAVVASSGKMDGGPLQYNAEWVRDASMVASGAVLSGMSEVGGAILDRLLTRSVDDEGRTMDSGRHRPPEVIELDQNGELLNSVYTHWVWTGDDRLLREHWPRIRAVADYVLRPEFRDPASGLVKNTREFWERGPVHGVRQGYELAHQVWIIVGLEKAAGMAAHLGEAAAAARWREASRTMKTSLLGDPRLALVSGGRFIKRRLADGGMQEALEPPDRLALSPQMPLAYEKVPYCDPDTTMALPIALGLVDPRGDLARNTLAALEPLWNQRWTLGGYGRYHVASEPDSPGPWPFATLFVARAYLEAGDSEKVWRALNWMSGIQGGRSGGWLEFYGWRPVPPMLPVGFIPWIWAEVITLAVHHLLGLRPSPSELVIRPRLLAGLERLTAGVSVAGHRIDLLVTRTGAEPRATINGVAQPISGRELVIGRPDRPLRIELAL